MKNNTQCELVQERHERVLPPCGVIDAHAHFGPLLLGEEYERVYDTTQICRWLDELGVERIFCLELVWDEAFDRLRRKLESSEGRILPVGSVDVLGALETGFAADVRRIIHGYHEAGCVALKLWKNMTLFPQRMSGRSLRLDDPAYEPIWDACAEEGLPVIIHVADPPCFFKPITPENEHFACLSLHPEWSFHRPDMMFSFEDHMEMQERVIAGHPEVRFIVAHVGSYAENLPLVSRWLDAYPNLSIDVAARLDQLGRQPYTAKRFIERHADRILFGTDYEARFDEAHTRWFYHTHYRFFQTEDEYFDHPFPEMLGQWKVCGLGLGADVLRKLYRDNAIRLFGLPIDSGRSKV